MTANEVLWIKQRQKEYKEVFGKDLIIDFAAMVSKKIPYDPKIIDELASNYKVDLDEFRNNSNSTKRLSANTRSFLRKVSLLISRQGWTQKVVATYLNRERTLFSHYSDYKRSVKRKEEARKLRANRK